MIWNHYSVYHYLVMVVKLKLMDFLCVLMKQSILFIVLLSTLFARAQTRMKDLAGKWRGEFIIRQNLPVPFNFEITADGIVYLVNADERFETGKIDIRKDSLF